MPGGQIQLVSLTKKLSEVAVDGIDLTITGGEFFSLLGPSGCGKTATLRLIAGLEQPTSRQVLLDGADVTNVPAHKRNVNAVFQSYALFPFLSVDARGAGTPGRGHLTGRREYSGGGILACGGATARATRNWGVPTCSVM